MPLSLPLPAPLPALTPEAVAPWRRIAPRPPLLALLACATLWGALLLPGHRPTAAGLGQAGAASAALLALGLWSGQRGRLAQRRARLHEELQRAYRTATEGANDGFYLARPVRDGRGAVCDFTIVDCNARGAYFYGMAREQLLGKRLSELDQRVFGGELLASYKAALSAGYLEEERQMPALPHLNFSWAQRRLVRVGDSLAVTLKDLSHSKEHQAQLQHLVTHDSLTALPNRGWLNQYLPAALQRAGAAGQALALLFIDLDDFKHVNDTQGHDAGDALLQQAAARLGGLLRPGDHVVRFGGDEFIVLLQQADTDPQLRAVAERILAAFAQPFQVGEESQAVGASVGISVYPRDGADAATLIRHGDIAMYAGKSEGKGQYRFFNPALSARLHKRARLRHSLVEAMEQGQLLLYYQPRVDTQTGELRSMEALLRWRHPELGLIPPADFIPLAESSGLILRLGEQVMDMACAQLAAWHEAGMALVPVSINVSPRQFTKGKIHRQLAQCLERHDLPASMLEVEITESAMMGEQAEILAELSAIRALGIKLHVDDFGTGYSSLSQLQKLKMDVLKVDKAFTSELGNSVEGRVFFQAIVSMAQALGMAVVAEGVETAAQLAILQELGCNEVQGYYVARPAPAAEMAGLMARRYLFPAHTRQTQQALRLA